MNADSAVQRDEQLPAEQTSRFSRKIAAYGASALIAFAIVAVSQRPNSDAAEATVTAGTNAPVRYIEFSATGSEANSPMPQSATTQRASVQELTEGLAQRLAREPNDAKGWTLLAQSYSYMGNADGVESAIAQAVRLGLEERDLRALVAAARPQATDSFAN